MNKSKMPDGELLYHAACIGDDYSSSDSMVGRKVYGVGVNDADYSVTKNKVDGKKKTQIWMCPYYNQWKHILERGYSLKFKARNPSYLLVSVCENWHLFSNFKTWMEKQPWENMEMDKDILVANNLEYSENSCCFVPKKVNNLLIDRFRGRGDFLLGVHFNPNMKNKYIASVSHNGKRVYLGSHPTPERAHAEWQKAKSENIKDTVNWWKTDVDHLHTYQKNVAKKLLEIADELWNNSQAGITTYQL